MTANPLTALVRHDPRPRPLRAAPLLRALAVAAIAALAILALGAGPAPPGTSGPARVALVLDAGADADRALGQARAWAARAERRGEVAATVRVPRTAAEALTDVRYFAAQRYDVVVVAGARPRAAAAR